MKQLLKLEIGTNRVYGLDIMRCMAILLVLISHSICFLPKVLAPYFNYVMLDGVTIFFVLSGFLVGGILIRINESNGLSWRGVISFWKKRWFRTLPNYFLILGGMVLMQILFVDDFNFNTVRAYFYFSQNITNAHPPFFPEAWSLSIEEWFYLLVPLAIFAVGSLSRWPARKILFFTILFVIIAVFLLRLQRYISVPATTVREYEDLFRRQVVTRLDALMFGLMGAYLSFFHHSAWIKHSRKLFVAGLLVLLLSRVFVANAQVTLYECVFSFSVDAIAALCLIPHLTSIRPRNKKVFEVVTCLSLISYSMYLVNLSVVQVLIMNNIELGAISAFGQGMIKCFLFWFLTILFSLFIYKYFELPTTRLREKIKWV